MFSPIPVVTNSMLVLGYVPWEVGLGFKLPPVDKSFKLRVTGQLGQQVKRVMAVSLGIHVHGAVSFWPDTTNGDGAILGVMKRIATEMPETESALFLEFESFCINFIERHLKCCIIPSDADLSVEKWLEGTSYPAFRKAMLLSISQEYVGLKIKDFVVDSHCKYESYNEPKMFRGIYSRSDKFKTEFGPICAFIGKIFFNLVWFVKYLDSDQKRDRMKELFDTDLVKVFSNDFTSFEATFTKLLMQIECYFLLFCCQNLPNVEVIRVWLERIKLGKNFLKFKAFVCELEAKRYSGEMDTSLGNSFFNLMFVCFLLHKSGHPERFYVRDFPPQIEGDDCLGAFIHPLDGDLLLRLGAKAKLEFFDSFSEASFCGMVFTGSSNNIVRDPIPCILDFGYVHYRYLNMSNKTRLALIRAKGLSLLYMYPGCPILRSLALFALRITCDISDKFAVSRAIKGELNSYKRDMYTQMLSYKFSDKLSGSVDISSRLLVESKFRVPVFAQLEIERYLDGKNDVSPINCPVLLEYCGSARSGHFQTHVVDAVEIYDSEIIKGWKRKDYGVVTYA